jgi:hypothetical protein
MAKKAKRGGKRKVKDLSARKAGAVKGGATSTKLAYNK